MKRIQLLILLMAALSPAFAFAGIDYSIWQLQEPSGSGNSPTIISSSQMLAGYSDAYFYTASDGGQVFMDTQTGITTSGSVHPRCEMREMTTAGADAAWAMTGYNIMTVTGQVLLLGDGTSGKTTIGQVFNSTGDIPLLEFQYVGSVGGFEVLYEEAKGGGTYTNLGVPCALNTPYTFVLSLSNNTLAVTINGVQAYTYTPSSAVQSDDFYFKCGNYDQTATAGAVSTTPYTEVEDYGVTVYHGSTAPTATSTTGAVNTATASATNSATHTATNTATHTSTMTQTSTVTVLATDTSTFTTVPNTATATQTSTATSFLNTATLTSTSTSTSTTLVDTATSTSTNTVTSTFTPLANSPTSTLTHIPTSTLTATNTTVPNTATFTSTSVPVNTSTTTQTGTSTSTVTSTQTFTSTTTSTNSVTPLRTSTETSTATGTNTPTNSATLTVTPTVTASRTNSPTATATSAAQPVAYPNPATGDTVTLQLPAMMDSNVSVHIYTLAFRSVQTISLGKVVTGSVVVPLRDKESTLLANGLYYFRVQANGQSWTLKVLVLR